MRVAYVCADPEIPAFGTGVASIRLQEVVRTLVRRGDRVSLFATNIDGGEVRALSGVALRRYAAVERTVPVEIERAALHADRDLAPALDAARPLDLVWERFSPWSRTAMEWARESGVWGILDVDAPLAAPGDADSPFLRPAVQDAAHRALDAATLVTTVSRGVAESIRRFHPAAAARVRVVPNGVDPRRFGRGLRPARPAAGGAFTVGFAATMRPWHDVRTLAAAFFALRAWVPGVRLLVVGDGPGRSALEASLAGLGVLPAVEWTGAVAPDRLPRLLASMDAAVILHAAEAPDVSPLEVFEHMAAGRAIVASAVGQLSEVVEDGVTGLAVPPGDPAALAGALERLHGDPDLRRRLGTAARDRAIRRHSWDRVVERILAPVLADLEQVA